MISLCEVVCDSTNDYAMAHRDLAHNAVIFARKQEGGKGREGRKFISHEGGAYFSIVRRDNLAFADAYRYMMAAAVACCEVVRSLGVQCAIKWPNDLRVGRKKLGGILIETACSPEGICYGVIGIGLNVNNRLEGVDCPCCSLGEMLHREIAVERLIVEIAEAFDRWVFAEELADVYRRWLMTLGKEVLLTSGRVGLAKDVGPDGRLAVDVDGATVWVSAGDVRLKEDVC